MKIKLGKKKVCFKSGSGKFFYGYPLTIEKYKGYGFYVITEKWKFEKTIIEESTGWYVCTLYCYYKDFEKEIKKEFIDKISIKRMKLAVNKARLEIKKNDRT